jgi:hypothetical protein
MPATLTKNPRTTAAPSPVTVKQGKPSTSGEVVDTKQARLIAQDAAKSKAKVAAEVSGAVEKMVQRDAEAAFESLDRDNQDRAEAVKELHDEDEAKKGAHKPPKAKAKAAAKKGSTSVHRITDEWTSAKGKDVAVKDRVKTSDGVVLDVVGRWTRKGKTGNVPMVTGHIVTLPTDAMVGKDKGIGDRHNAVAAEVAHTK